MLIDIDDMSRNNSKLIQQIHSAEKLGYSVYFFGYSVKGIFLCHNKKKKFFCRTINVKNNFLKRNQLYRAMLHLLDTGIHFDYCYVRKMLTTVNYGRCLKKMHNQGIRVVVEIPTYPDYEEYKNDKRQYRRLVFSVLKHFDKHYSKYVDLFALIGEPANQYFGRKAINIQNGIDTDNTSRWMKNRFSDDLNALVIANFCSWHGIERLISGLRQYQENNGKNKIRVHLVGPDCDGSLKEWKDMAVNNGVGDSVIVYGRKYGKELDSIVNECDIAFSSLGEYKKGINNASELKLLNYCARGIPFVYCTSFDREEEIGRFCLKIENDASSVDFFRIIEFIDKLPQRNEVVESLRSFSKKNFCWEKQLEKVFQELDKC